MNMTNTLMGTLRGQRSLRPAAARTAPEPPAAATRSSDGPAVCSLGSSFDDTAWAAALGCRPLFAARTRP